MSIEKRGTVFLVTAVAGLAIWLIIAAVSGKNEAWDSDYFYIVGIPAMLIVSGTAGFIEPVQPWLWGIAVVSFQPIALFFRAELGPLALVGLFTFGIFAVLCMGSAYAGASLRQWRRKDS